MCRLFLGSSTVIIYQQQTSINSLFQLKYTTITYFFEFPITYFNKAEVQSMHSFLIKSNLSTKLFVNSKTLIKSTNFEEDYLFVLNKHYISI
jgi:hypothetical protein